MNSNANAVYVVDDEAEVRDMLTFVLTNAGYHVVCFADGAALLAVARKQFPVCILLDVFINDSSGLDILQKLNVSTYPAPVLMMSGRGCIAMAVDAMTNGACDFIEKPFSGNQLMERIERAKKLFAERATDGGINSASHEQLTGREEEVLAQWIAGGTSKEIARRLQISPRTVELHRSKIMKKLRAKNSAQIVQIAMSHRARPV